MGTAENRDLIARIFAGLEIGDGRLLFESMTEGLPLDHSGHDEMV
jgi:hypothetical protein